GITEGPDFNLWFAESAGNKIGRITPFGVIKEYPLSTENSVPTGIARGPDNALWFSEGTGNKIGRLTTSGTFEEFAVPTQGSSPAGITAGGHGDLWFAEYAGNAIGRITPSGSIAEYRIPTPNSRPVGITLGLHGNIWFAELNGDRIGRVDVAALSRRPASLALTGVRVVDGSGKPQTTFHPRAKGYLVVSWAIQNLSGTTTISIKRSYEVPSGSRWRPWSSAQSGVAVGNGPGSATFEFVAPIHYTSYRIEVSIKFLSKWLTGRAVVVGVKP
ncbi:MAG: hypothetical protein JOZ41_04815, partial [Chloroflexi bacterium]|nr:hypothetical protein [Chloroflexota bacterium]